jgi:hypothetical protein
MIAVDVRVAAHANAVTLLAARLSADMVRKRLAREGISTRGGPSACLRRLRARYELDLLGFLNGATVHELRALAAALEIPSTSAPAAALRHRLWTWGAALELRAIGQHAITLGVQPVPTLSSAGRLSLARRRPIDDGPLPAARDARFPPCDRYPRAVPDPRPAPAPTTDPDSLDDLLRRADALLGVRLGTRGRDKGAFGRRISDLLGIRPSSSPAADWRATVEIKSLAVTRALEARWRLKDGPAIAMRSVDPGAKLARVLWIVRVDERELPDSPVLSWFYQELDADLTAALERARHLRPKGGAGTLARGWYLRRDYFDACGLLRSLNG